MATPLQVFLVTMAFGGVVGGFGIWLAVTSRREEAPKDR